MFSSLQNIPPEPIEKDFVSDKPDKETVGFYLINKKDIIHTPDKPFYRDSGLMPLWRHDDIDRELGLTFRAYTDGENNLYMIGKKRLCGELDPSHYELGYQRDMENKQIMFHPSFFKIVGSKGLALVRIQAPEVWHDQRYRRPAIDPKIDLIWEPKHG